MQKEKGSILVLTVISVLILSIMVIGLLTVGTTEIQTTQNFHLNKAAYYVAVEGIEDIRIQIMQNPGSPDIGSITKSVSETQKRESFISGLSDRQFRNLGIERSYVTGNLKDFHENTFRSPKQWQKKEGDVLGQNQMGQFTGRDLSDPNFRPPVIWEILVTAEAGMGNRKGYSEIIAGIYTDNLDE